ncbi:mechanosensitive ion channel family protein [Halomonas korlensis]|nr:mechanosensitive ion channel domain-containing protein [Halomonas korlensis]
MKLISSWLLLAVMAMTLAFSSVCIAQSEDEDEDEESQQWFSIDTLNEGLGDVPEDLSRLTPRDAIRSFMELTENKEFGAAAHVLNLSNLSPEEQKSRGSLLARQLSSVLRRGEWLDLSDLSGRPDAVIEDPSGQNPQAGEPQRNLQLASLDVDGETYDIRLARYRVDDEDEDAVWLVSPESISSIPLLYEEYGPSWLESHIPERFHASYGMLKIWEWIAIPVFLLAIGLVGWGVHFLVGLASQWLPSGLPSIFVSQIKVSMALVVMSLVAQSLLDYAVSFSAVATTFFHILLITIMAWGVGTIALRLVDTFMLKMTRRLIGEIDDTKPRDERKLLTTLYALRRGIILVMVVAVAIYVLGQIELFETLGVTLLASASVLTVLVGIAGQTVLSNILSSFQVSLAKPIRVGDLVIFEGHWSYVEGIFYTFIRLRTWDERRLNVPVTYFLSKPFENLSVKSAKMYRCMVLTLHLSADVACLREKFKEFAEAEENVIEHHKLLCYVTGQTEMAQQISFYLMTSEPMSGWAAEMNVREKMLAFIRDNHPEWWPRDVVVFGRHDVALGEKPADRSVTRPATVTDSPKPGPSAS